VGQLGALSGKGDILYSNQAQSRVLCSVQVQMFFLPSTVYSNSFSQCLSSKPFLVNDQHDAHFFTMYLFLTLYMFRALHAHHQERQIVSTQFVSPDDERDVLETCRELKIKINT
jgi:hypothetical protein